MFLEIVLSLFVSIVANPVSNDETDSREQPLNISLMNVPALDPDLNKNVSELITGEGYPVEEYKVTTSDGYILSLIRIPAKNFDENTKVILLQHGVLGSASDFVMNLREQSLGFALSDQGYDIWLPNARGNVYSRKHVTLKPTDEKFWMFSWDDIALKDLPANIDYILEKTGRTRLQCVGYSMGTTVLFALLSEKPEYNAKVTSFVALAPVVNVTYMTSSLRYVVPLGLHLYKAINEMGDYSFLAKTDVVKLMSDLLCGTGKTVLCQSSYFLITGTSQVHLTNLTRMPVYAHHIPAGTSSPTIAQYGQCQEARRFQTYDWGELENFRRYGQATPKEYRVENIQVPVALFYGLADYLADIVDVQLLIPRIKYLSLDYQISDPEWSHTDVILATRAKQIFYQPLFQELNKYR